MNEAAQIRFSVVIPAFNEEAFLPRLLDSIAVAKAQYSGGAGAIEVIVADNDSTDRTAQVAAERGARVVHVAKRRIAPRPETAVPVRLVARYCALSTLIRRCIPGPLTPSTRQ